MLKRVLYTCTEKINLQKRDIKMVHFIIGISFYIRVGFWSRHQKVSFKFKSRFGVLHLQNYFLCGCLPSAVTTTALLRCEFRAQIGSSEQFWMKHSRWIEWRNGGTMEFKPAVDPWESWSVLNSLNFTHMANGFFSGHFKIKISCLRNMSWRRRRRMVR